MLVLLLALFGPGCKADHCQTLCASVARRLDACREEWGATWEDLGAVSRADLRQTCQDELDIERGDWPARQIPEADAQCEDAAADLAAVSCDGLRALYLP